MGGWEADVSVLVSIPEGKTWETQVVIKESLTEGLFTEVWQGYKSQQGDMRCWEGFPPPGLKRQEREWHGLRPVWLEKRCSQQLWPQLEGPAELHPGSEGEGGGGNPAPGPPDLLSCLLLTECRVAQWCGLQGSAVRRRVEQRRMETWSENQGPAILLWREWAAAHSRRWEAPGGLCWGHQAQWHGECSGRWWEVKLQGTLEVPCVRIRDARSYSDIK